MEEDRERNAKLDDAQLQMRIHTDLMKEKTKQGMEMHVQYHHKCHELERVWLKLKCELMEQKMGLMTDREELQKKIQEQSQWKEKHEKVQAARGEGAAQAEVRSRPKGQGPGRGSTVVR